jgi:deoxyribodipyrimidine photo-lyase
MSAVLFWYRSELRLHDNAALQAACSLTCPIIPVFIQDPITRTSWKRGAASSWWLHYALKDLSEQLESRRSKLILRLGEERAELERLIEETSATHIIWSQSWEPFRMKQDRALADYFEQKGITVSWYEDHYLFSPNAIENASGKPFQVFTPFWRHCLKHSFPATIRLAEGPLLAPKEWPNSVSLESFNFLPKISWDTGFARTWTPTRQGAEALLQAFATMRLRAYTNARDFPEVEGTSRLSPYLHCGQIGIREVVEAIQAQSADGSCYLSELGWREFAGHLLYHFPKMPEAPLRGSFEDFPWKDDSQCLEAWQQGRTGYPIVDAGMRQLWETGWMHNRVRMIAGSVLVKHFLQPWQAGARWFWDTLVDADLANNTLGWQWVAGCGADAAPYFRVFNPVLQGKKFDPDGAYVKRYIPELRGVDKRYIHEPWTLGMYAPKDYAAPRILPDAGRRQALEAYGLWKKRH